jgi:hypothetical protein
MMTLRSRPVELTSSVQPELPQQAEATLWLWHGDTLAGLQVSRFLETGVSELDELRLVDVEHRITVERADGSHGRP